MREMHKWKDKVELSLDNRQIFFLFFGLSVVGCFVFALGVMTARRLEWDPEGRVAALSDADSLSLLEAEEAEGFKFMEGLADSAAADLPPTRDPSVPPRDEDEVKAEKEAAKEAAKLAKAEPTPALPGAAKVPAAHVGAADPVEAKVKAKANKDAAMANVDKASATAEADADKRVFTLQIKTFSRKEEADKLAAKLRGNGHEVRVDEIEKKGRIWYRVCLGSFTSWDDGLEAKGGFEKAERMIAYVVAQ